MLFITHHGVRGFSHQTYSLGYEVIVIMIWKINTLAELMELSTRASSVPLVDPLWAKRYNVNIYPTKVYSTLKRIKSISKPIYTTCKTCSLAKRDLGSLAL